MLSCDDARRMIARAAEGASPAPPLEDHLKTCADCRAALAEQQLVVRALSARAPGPVPADFSARVSARIDRESEPGFLDLANWRRWTIGLAPVAAALTLAAYLGAGLGAHDVTPPAGTAAATEVSFDSWQAAAVEDTPASVFLQAGASSEALLETVLTGAAPGGADPGGADVR